MNFAGTKLGVPLVVLLLVIAMASSKSIDVSEPEPFQNSRVEFSNGLPDDAPTKAEIFNYLLRKELLSRQENPIEWEKRQGYYKPCAFNAVTCFGKK